LRQEKAKGVNWAVLVPVAVLATFFLRAGATCTSPHGYRDVEPDGHQTSSVNVFAAHLPKPGSTLVRAAPDSPVLNLFTSKFKGNKSSALDRANGF
jgi:hypothetical protein